MLIDRRHREPYSDDLKNDWQDWQEEKAEWFKSGKVYQEPEEALKRDYITEEEYNNIIQDQANRWGEK